MDKQDVTKVVLFFVVVVFTVFNPERNRGKKKSLVSNAVPKIPKFPLQLLKSQASANRKQLFFFVPPSSNMAENNALPPLAGQECGSGKIKTLLDQRNDKKYRISPHSTASAQHHCLPIFIVVTVKSDSIYIAPIHDKSYLMTPKTTKLVLNLTKHHRCA